MNLAKRLVKHARAWGKMTNACPSCIDVLVTDIQREYRPMVYVSGADFLGSSDFSTLPDMWEGPPSIGGNELLAQWQCWHCRSYNVHSSLKCTHCHAPMHKI